MTEQEPDYKAMWEEIRDSLSVLDANIYQIDKIEKKHTPWKPKVGEWTWCEMCKRPISYHPVSHHPYTGWAQPLAPHLPILEYNGFKVGEKVRVKGFKEDKTIRSFDFPDNQDVTVFVDIGGFTFFNLVEHLPPPEPKELGGVPTTSAGWMGVRDRRGEMILLLAKVKEMLEWDYKTADENMRMYKERGE